VPTLLRWKGYRFWFWAGDEDEPPHVHVRKGDNVAKFWLAPVELATNQGFRSHEINEIRKAVRKHVIAFLEAWNDYFDR